MKAAMIALTMVGFVGSTALAEEDIDILKANCRPFGTSVRTSAFLMFWLDGTNREQVDTTLHMNSVWTRATKLSAYCARHPDNDLRDALDDMFYLGRD